MISEKKVETEKSRLLEGVGLVIKQRLREVVAHALDVNTVIKPSTITITITVTPDEERELYTTDVTHAVKLAPHKGFRDTFVGGTDEDGDVVVRPVQTGLFTQ